MSDANWFVPQDVADTLIDGCTAAITAKDAPTYLRGLKALVRDAVRLMPRDARRALHVAMDPETDTGFLEQPPRWPDLNDPTLEKAALAWGLVVPAIEAGKFGTKWDLDFAVKKKDQMLGRGRWSNWTPTEKEIVQIKRLFRSWRHEANRAKAESNDGAEAVGREGRAVAGSG